MLRIVKLAWRTVFVFRKEIVPGVALVAISSFLFVMFGAASTPLRDAVRATSERLEGIEFVPAFVADAKAIPVFVANVTDPAVTIDEVRSLIPLPITNDPIASGSIVWFENDEAQIRSTALTTWSERQSEEQTIEPANQPGEMVRRRIRDLGFWVGLLLGLFSLASLMPNAALLSRRMQPSHAVLHVWGFPERSRRAWVFSTAGLAAGAAAVAGGAVGLLVAAVGSARGSLAIGLFPPGLIPLSNESLLSHVPVDPGQSALTEAISAALITPSVGYFAAVVVVSTLLGAVSALPSLDLAATVGMRKHYGGRQHTHAQHRIHAPFRLPNRNASRRRR